MGKVSARDIGRRTVRDAGGFQEGCVPVTYAIALVLRVLVHARFRGGTLRTLGLSRLR